jgi:hypothetical protein
LTEQANSGSDTATLTPNQTVFLRASDGGRTIEAMHKKPHLPEKICQHCGRPYSWRKKWERVWDEVKYCSERCRREHKRTAQ